MIKSKPRNKNMAELTFYPIRNRECGVYNPHKACKLHNANHTPAVGM
jgi:hypothetical protein